MRIEVDYNGKTYIGVSEKMTDQEHDKFVEKFYDNFAVNFTEFSTFRLVLNDGGLMIFGRAAMELAVFRFYKK